ncbi:hypothetical protein KAF25_009193 [Fusarium avenaceum]|uniref:Sulfotransferase domain-containing protein n=1 Tax=Fusarium avenaceum TaxID=40199 RepID=A0A9P7KN05_9HYPO|nr:hypothetical protein KAF25_009193 [Fusarium avenaceum]
MSPKTARHVFLTASRTASHLLLRIINIDAQNAQDTDKNGYFWLSAMYMRNVLNSRPMCEWSPEEKKSLDDMEQKCFNNLLDYINIAEEAGKIVMFKEHAMLLNDPFIESRFIHGENATIGQPKSLKGYPDGISSFRSPLNKTILSDDFLKTLKPTFLIRHPASTIPSLFRAIRHEGFDREVKELEPVERSLYWQRKLLEFYEESYKAGEIEKPIVLDADDMMTSQELMLKYAKVAGLDPEKLRFSWEKAPQEVVNSMPSFVQHMLGSLNSSEKVDLSKVVGDVDISQEAVKWKAEFGDEHARKLETYVREAMDDYEYMRSKRLTL